MSPKQKMITALWCAVTMMSTMVLSHGHLVMREVMLHWPAESSWEGRIENALYTQGGLFFVASLLIGVTITVRGYFARIHDEQLKRRELSQREKHERAAAVRHEALLDSLTNLHRGTSEGLAEALPPKKSSASDSSRTVASAAKSSGSGARPR